MNLFTVESIMFDFIRDSIIKQFRFENDVNYDNNLTMVATMLKNKAITHDNLKDTLLNPVYTLHSEILNSAVETFLEDVNERLDFLNALDKKYKKSVGGNLND